MLVQFLYLKVYYTLTFCPVILGCCFTNWRARKEKASSFPLQKQALHPQLAYAYLPYAWTVKVSNASSETLFQCFYCYIVRRLPKSDVMSSEIFFVQHTFNPNSHFSAEIQQATLNSNTRQSLHIAVTTTNQCYPIVIQHRNFQAMFVHAINFII